jgi:effector-binding domain-containing protein
MILSHANKSREESAMRTSRSALVLFAFGAALLFVSAAPLSAVQTADVSVQKVEPFAYFCMRVKGSYSQIQEAVGRLMQEVQAQNAMPTGPLMGIYYNDPAKVDSRDLEWEIGFPFSPSHIIQTPLVVKEWNFSQVAQCLHKGPYADLGKTVAKVLEWMNANGYVPAGPVLERYLDMNPAELNPQDLKTEIWIPCQKK